MAGCDPVEVRLLGGFALRSDVGWLRLPGPSARVVALLALDGRVGREHLARTLWPDVPARRADSYVRTALWRLNAAAPGLVVTTGGQLELARGTLVDACAVLGWAARTLGESAAAGPVPADDIGRELLPSWEDCWLDAHRERLRVLVPEALETQARSLLADDLPAQALASALRAHQLDPLRESSVRIMAECHLQRGNSAAALRVVTDYRSLLRAELGVEVGPELVRLVEPLRFSAARTARGPAGPRTTAKTQ